MTTDPTRACRGTDTDRWFRDRETGPDAVADTDLAKRTCLACPVRDECLATAMAEEKGRGRGYRHGVRGGLTSLERYNLAVRIRRRELLDATT